MRILEVLLSVPDRETRAALLPDAFTPPGSVEGGSTLAAVGNGDAADEELLYTTPLRLLQAIDLAAARAEGIPDEYAALPGGGHGLSSAELCAVLADLREDVLGYWEGTAPDL